MGRCKQSARPPKACQGCESGTMASDSVLLMSFSNFWSLGTTFHKFGIFLGVIFVKQDVSEDKNKYAH